MQDNTTFDSVNSVPETVVGATVKIQGDLNSDGNIRIDGQVQGTVSTKQNVQIGENAIITADVTAGNATIGGKVKGNVKIAGQLYLQKSAHITGDITCSSLKVDDGAVFNGKCSMGNQQSSPDNHAE